MPTQTRNKKTGLLMFHPTIDEKDYISVKHTLRKRDKTIENLRRDLNELKTIVQNLIHTGVNQ